MKTLPKKSEHLGFPLFTPTWWWYAPVLRGPGLWNLILAVVFTSTFIYILHRCTWILQAAKWIIHGRDCFDWRPTEPFSALRNAGFLDWSLCTQVRPAVQGERISLQWGYVPKKTWRTHDGSWWFSVPILTIWDDLRQSHRSACLGPSQIARLPFRPRRQFIAESARKSVDHFRVD